MFGVEGLAWILIAVFVAFVLGGTVAARAMTRSVTLVVSSDDERELDELGSLLLLEHHREVGAPLRATLERIHSRGVPLTSVRPDGGVRRQYVLGFADGSGILARPKERANPGTLLMVMQRHAIIVRQWADAGDAYVVELAWRGGRSLWEAVALGRSALSA